MDFEDLTDLIGSGGEADVYRSGQYAIKLFKEHCSKKEVFYEASIHTVIEGTKLPVPRIHSVVKISNRWAIVMDMVEGVTMKDVILSDLQNRNQHIDNIIDLQLKMHETEIEGLNRLNEKLASKITSTNVLDSSKKSNLIKKLNGFDTGSKLCHGDFHFSNLIKTDDEIMIIDWIDASCGNPEADVCRAYLLYKLYAKEIADVYLDIYCRKSQKRREEILKWLPIIAAARLFENKPNEVEGLIGLIEPE